MGGECGALMNTDYTLQRLFKQVKSCVALQSMRTSRWSTLPPTVRRSIVLFQGELRVIDAADVEWNIQNHGGERYQGGEAVVHIVEWHNRSGAPSSWTIDEGLRVALKVYRRRPNGQEQPKAAHNEDDAKEEGGPNSGVGSGAATASLRIQQQTRLRHRPAVLTPTTSLPWLLTHHKLTSTANARCVS